MLCLEDQSMSEHSSMKKSLSSHSFNSSPSDELKARKYTWAEEVSRDEIGLDDSRSCSGHDTSNESAQAVQKHKSFNSKLSMAEVEVANSKDRKISIDFIESINEQKYEVLVKADKIRTPFKRRHSNTHSNDSRSNSPSDANNVETGSDAGVQNLLGSTYKAEKRLRHQSCNSSLSSSSYTESNPAVLSRRQKQIEYGKNTVAYDHYMALIPKNERTRDHPRTPNKYGKYSRRAFDGLIKIWRKQLHYYDPPRNMVENGDKNKSVDSDLE